MPRTPMKLLALVLSLASAGVASADSPAKHDASRIEIAITRSGFDPGSVTVPAKKPLTLAFTRKTDATCAKSVVVTGDDGKTIERELPLDKTVEIPVTFSKAGTLSYACSMHMLKGVIVVQ